MMSPIFRVMSFFSKWSAEVLRQPSVMITLIAGPFLVLLAFGTGIDISEQKPRTIIVRPAEADDEAIQPLPEDLNERIEVVEETTNLDAARERLRQGEVDAVAVLPASPLDTVQGGEQVPLILFIDEIDPVNVGFTRAFLREQVSVLNQRTVAKAITDAQEPLNQAQDVVNQARPIVDSLQESPIDLDEAANQLDTLRGYMTPLSVAADAAVTATRGASFIIPGLGVASEQAERLQSTVDDLDDTLGRLERQLEDAREAGAIPTQEEIAEIDRQLTDVETSIADLQAIPPEVLSAPFRLELENVSPSNASVTAYYAPAVMVLLIQHLAITLAALSMSRVRSIGLMDMLRVAPVRAWEVVAGNYVSYGTLVALVAVGLFAALVGLLDVPNVGSMLTAGVVLGLLMLTSLGAGLVISLISKDEQQAAQIAMLVLLASIFFSGFVFALDRVTWPAKVLSFMLPSTYAIRALQDTMLRGIVQHDSDILVLAGAACALFIVAVLLFRREFRSVAGSRSKKAMASSMAQSPEATRSTPGAGRPASGSPDRRL